MNKKIETFLKNHLKKGLPDLRPGNTVKVYQKIKEGDKEKTQIFEGLLIARKHGKEIGSTITVRKIIAGVGVERIFPVHSPNIEKIEISKKGRFRRAKLYYLRKAKGKRARLKKKIAVEILGAEMPNHKIENNSTESTESEKSI